MTERMRGPDRGRTPERVRITHPRTTTARSLPTRPPAREIDELTELGEVYLASLLRTQRRTAFTACAVAIGALLGLAVAAAGFTGWSGLTVFGISLPWLLVGVLVYPVLLLIGLVAVRRSERDEQEFAALMQQR
jgi:hypothetical protein